MKYPRLLRFHGVPVLCYWLHAGMWVTSLRIHGFLLCLTGTVTWLLLHPSLSGGGCLLSNIFFHLFVIQGIQDLIQKFLFLFSSSCKIMSSSPLPNLISVHIDCNMAAFRHQASRSIGSFRRKDKENMVCH